jgi:hypothetical protein
MNPLKQAKQWFKVRQDWLGEGGQPSPKAQLRANQCISCPWHDDQHPIEEAAKRAVVNLTLDLKRKNNWHVEGEEKLHLCGLCWCLLETKVFTPLEVARTNTPDWEKFPSYCWMHWTE